MDSIRIHFGIVIFDHIIRQSAVKRLSRALYDATYQESASRDVEQESYMDKHMKVQSRPSMY